MARRATKTQKPTRSSNKYQGMTLKQLRDMEAEVKAAIMHAEDRERAALKDRIEQMAQNSGFSVNELFSGRSTKGKTVAPKYMNPDNKTETWTGRGRKPRWLVAKLDKGAKLDDFSI